MKLPVDWKTSLAGLAVVFLGIAFLMGRLDLHEFLGAFALLTGVGLHLSKDSA